MSVESKSLIDRVREVLALGGEWHIQKNDDVIVSSDTTSVLGAANAAADLARFALAFVEALPVLKQRHRTFADSDLPSCSATLPEGSDGPHVCECHAGTINATITRLASLLGVTIEGKPL